MERRKIKTERNEERKHERHEKKNEYLDTVNSRKAKWSDKKEKDRQK